MFDLSFTVRRLKVIFGAWFMQSRINWAVQRCFDVVELFVVVVFFVLCPSVKTSKCGGVLNVKLGTFW